MHRHTESAPASADRALLREIEQVASQAADYIRAQDAGRSTLTWDTKGESDFVSAVDRGAEALIRDPSRPLIATGVPFRKPDAIARYLTQLPKVLATTSGIRRAGSAAIDLAHVACGRVDAFWELRLAPWDVAAGLLLVREAGGVVTDFDGTPSVPAFAGYVAGNPVMHAWLLETLT